MQIELVDYDPTWPQDFARTATRLQNALGAGALALDHVGSTSVPGLCAKPIIDINLTVGSSAREELYRPELERAGYRFILREPAWFEHRLFKGDAPRVNLHVFPQGAAELVRMRLFRDWLRHDAADRALYAEMKRRLAAQDWPEVQAYADAKSTIIEEIMTRARAWADAAAK